MSQGDGPRHEGTESDTKLACCKAMWLGTEMPKATQSLHVARQCGRARRCRKQHKACVSQGNVTKHDSAEGDTRCG
ncbi:unnamed protein product [Prunus armeniaca]